MMSTANSVWKIQSPRFKCAANVLMKGMLKFANVVGNSSKLEAKIGGIMLAMFTFSGKCAL
ncbi:hypothetical protein D3C83_290140 [compost metagenome]